MSKKKLASRSAVPLKDFHGGRIPADIALPSAPGMVAEKGSFDRLGIGGRGSLGLGPFGRLGNSNGFRDQVDRSGSLANMSNVGKNYDEDERRPVDAARFKSGGRGENSEDYFNERSIENEYNVKIEKGKTQHTEVAMKESQPPGAWHSEQAQTRMGNVQALRKERSTWGPSQQQKESGHVQKLSVGPKFFDSGTHRMDGLSTSKNSGITKFHSNLLGPNTTSLSNSNSDGTDEVLYANSNPNYNVNGSRYEEIRTESRTAEGFQARNRLVERNDNIYQGLPRMTGNSMDNLNTRELSGKSLASASVGHLSVSRGKDAPVGQVAAMSSGKGSSNVEPLVSALASFPDPSKHPQARAQIWRASDNSGEKSGIVSQKDRTSAKYFSGPVLPEASNDADALSAGEESRPDERPKLNLKPRSTSLEKNSVRTAPEEIRSSVFGGARPRELVLKIRGVEESAEYAEDATPNSCVGPSEGELMARQRSLGHVTRPPHIGERQGSWNSNQERCLDSQEGKPDSWRKPVADEAPLPDPLVRVVTTSALVDTSSFIPGGLQINVASHSALGERPQQIFRSGLLSSPAASSPGSSYSGKGPWGLSSGSANPSAPFTRLAALPRKDPEGHSAPLPLGKTESWERKPAGR